MPKPIHTETKPSIDPSTLGLNVVMGYREQFPEVLNQNGYLGEGVEVGVQFGAFSHALLKVWKGRCLYSIDPWRFFPPEANYVDVANRNQAQQDEIFRKAQELLRPFGERSQILRHTSEEAAPKFRAHQLDFVYLDAQHHYEAIVQDIDLWWPKVRPGGILGGHDYLDGLLKIAGDFGVKSAVDDFARAQNLPVLNTSHVDSNGQTCCPSWFLIKPL
jgi:Methyltransferase domain